MTVLLDSPPSVPRDQVKGRTEPRLWTPPLRPLTRETSRGFEANEFADMIGEPNLPHQQWLNIHALELTPLGFFRFRIVIVLMARQNGKSNHKRKVSLWRLYLDEARTVLGTAQDVALAREQMDLCKTMILQSPDLAAEYVGERNINGDLMFWLADDSLPTKAPAVAYPRYLVRATNDKAGRGLSVDELNIDELRTQHDWKAWAALSKTVMARRNAQIWVMSNAGDDNSVVLNQLRDAAGVTIGPDGISTLGEARDPTIGIFEWSGPDGCELDDIDAIAQANPALGHLINISSIDSARGTDLPDVYRTEVLCQNVDQLDGAIDLAAWKAGADPAGKMPERGLIVCFEPAEDGAHATLTAAVHLTDDRVRLRVVQAWPSAEEARSELQETLDALKPAVVVWFPNGPGAEFAPILRPKGLKPIKVGDTVRQMFKGVEYVELSGLKVTEACMGLAGLAKARQVLHSNDPLLNTHISGAQKQYTGDGWRFVRRDAGHCDAAYSAAGAAHIALTRPAAARPQIRSLTA